MAYDRKKLWTYVGFGAVIVFIIAFGAGFFTTDNAGITGNVVSEERVSLEEDDVNAAEKEIVKLGFMAPLTGDAASYGESIKRGVELALRDSGLDNVDIVFEDSRCEGRSAVNAVNKLISVDGVSAIVGEVCSGATLAAAPVAEENEVVMISSSSTSPKITESGDYIFRTVPSDALQGDFGANLVFDNGRRRLAIIFSNEEYGVGFNNVLEESFAELGGEVVASEAFERGAADLRTQLTKIKNANPDAIYVISNSPDSAVAVLRQIKELGIDAAIYGSEGLKSPDIAEGAGEAAEGLIVTSVSSGTTGFIENHKEAYGEEPGPFAAQAYDAFTSLAMAIKDGSLDSGEMKEYLYELEFDGASGMIDFDENGDIEGNYDVFFVKDGKFVS